MTPLLGSALAAHELKNQAQGLQLQVALITEQVAAGLKVRPEDREQLERFAAKVALWSRELGKDGEELRPEPTELSPLLVAAWHEARETYGAGCLDTVVTPELPQVLADPRRLRQVLHNLMGNALKHGGGRCGVTAAMAGAVMRRGQLVAYSRLPQPRDQLVVRLVIWDEGPGLPAGALEASAKRRGGLWLCQQLAAAMGGALHPADEYRQGTAWALYLPTWRQQPARPRVVAERVGAAA